VNPKLVFIMFGYLGLLLAGQVLWKKGLAILPGVYSAGITHLLLGLGGSIYIWSGLVLYGLATLLWLYLLSKYDLSYIYPFTSLSFVMAIFVSSLLLGETVTWNRWAGAVTIVLGVYLVSLK